MSQSFQRARSADQIAAREVAALDAARRLLDSNLDTEITLAAIAAEAGLVKSALYRYFESREEILVRVLIADIRDVAEAFNDRLPADSNIDSVVRITVETMVARPRFCMLLSHLHAVLEKNISVERLIELKREMMSTMPALGEPLQRALPWLSSEGSLVYLRVLQALVSGLWSGTAPSDVLRHVREMEEFTDLTQSFEESLEAALRLVLLGLRSEA